MRLESVTIRDLGPFREFTVDLDEHRDSKLIAICGRNGAGKSTLLELALPGAMFRSTPTRGSLVELATSRNAMLEAVVVNGQRWRIRHLVDKVSGKSEAVALDEDGNPATPDAKVRSFDAWAARHLPRPDVFFASMFAAQQGGGFIAMKASERKSTLLQILGVSRLEAMAERARERARLTRAALATLEARIADERSRGGDMQELLTAKIEACNAAIQSDLTVAAAKSAFEKLRAEAESARAAREAFRVACEKRDQIKLSIRSRIEQADAIQQRITNNRAVLADAKAIRAAVARIPEIDAQIADAQVEYQRCASETRALEREAAEHRKQAAEAQRRAGLSKQRGAQAAKRLEQRELVERAVAQLEGLRLAVQVAEGEVAASEAELERLRGEQIGGAEERISGLREALTRIANDDAFKPRETAGVALAEDERRAAVARERPAELARAEASLRAAQSVAAAARKVLAEAEALAARQGDIEAAAADLDAAAADERAALLEAKEAERKAEEAARAADVFGADADRALERTETAAEERGRLAPIAAKAEPLANAEARLAELEPQLARAVAERDQFTAELDALPEPQEPPPAPDLAPLERAVADAEEASRKAHAAVAVAEQRVADARVVAERIAALETERVTTEAELADWNRLAEDFGKSGLQALEIDAAGPELSELVNDLLRNAYGPRWTVTIETQRLSADGKRQLEGCEVRVLDTVGGREAEASTFSGGERVILGEAVSLALSMLACRRAGVEGPTLVRDESGAALDPANARAYVAMLRRAADIVGARHVLFVSHSPEVQELADSRIEIGGSNG